jgi:hypothetical protein
MAHYVDTETLLRTWLRGEDIKTEVLGMSLGLAFVDLRSSSGRMLGPAAVKFNRTLLIADQMPFPNEKVPDLFHRLAREERFNAREVSRTKLTRLRSVLPPEVVPSLTNVKAFRSWLPKDIRFPDLDVSDPVRHARIVNTFMHKGEMTHFIVKEWERDDDYKFSIVGYYPDADTAMLDYMKHQTPGQFRIVEIGR